MADPLEIAKLAVYLAGRFCVRRRADFLIDGGDGHFGVGA
jgi:hypothetical protein